MRVVRKDRAMAVEKLEVLARVHCKHQVGPPKARQHRVDGRMGEERVDLIKEDTAGVFEDHPELAHRVGLGACRVEFEVGRCNLAHRLDRMDAREAEDSNRGTDCLTLRDGLLRIRSRP